MKNNTVPKIFVIDNCEDTQRLFINYFAGKADVISAYNSPNALKILGREEGISLIVYNSNLADSQSEAINFIKAIRAQFPGLIVGLSDSSDDSYRSELSLAGCFIVIEPNLAPALVLTLLCLKLGYSLRV